MSCARSHSGGAKKRVSGGVGARASSEHSRAAVRASFRGDLLRGREGVQLPLTEGGGRAQKEDGRRDHLTATRIPPDADLLMYRKRSHHSAFDSDCVLKTNDRGKLEMGC